MHHNLESELTQGEGYLYLKSLSASPIKEHGVVDLDLTVKYINHTLDPDKYLAQQT